MSDKDDVFRLGRHRGKWVAIYGHGPKKRRRTLDADSSKSSKGEAERQVRELNIQAARAELGDDLTVGVVYELYVQDRERDGIPSVKRMREAWKPLEPHFGHLAIDQIDKRVCTDYIRKRRQVGVSGGGIRTELDYLSTALRFGRREKLFTCDVPAIERPPQARPRERWLTKAEVRRLIESAVAPHVKLFILLSVHTAGRPSHVLQLTWGRVDFAGRIINLDDPERDRTRKGRARVPMHDDLIDPLRMARELAETPFVIEYNGAPVKSVKKAIERAAKRARIKDVSPYVLRHTAGVWMAQAGVPIEQIAEYMGHTTPTITYKHYAKFHPEYLRRAADALRLGDGPLAIEDARS